MIEGGGENLLSREFHKRIRLDRGGDRQVE